MVTDRKKLVIDSYRDRRAASAHCALCGTTFHSGPDLKPDEAARRIYGAFDSHECERKNKKGCTRRVFQSRARKRVREVQRLSP